MARKASNKSFNCVYGYITKCHRPWVKYNQPNIQFEYSRIVDQYLEYLIFFTKRFQKFKTDINDRRRLLNLAQKYLSYYAIPICSVVFAERFEFRGLITGSSLNHEIARNVKLV